MASSAHISILATAYGHPYSSGDSTVGQQSIAATYSNTSAVGVGSWVEGSSSLPTAAEITPLTSARFFMLMPPTTFRSNYRVTGSTSEVGILLNQNFPFLMGNPTSFRVYSTSGSTVRLQTFQW